MTGELRSGQKVHGSCMEKLYPVRQPYCFHCGRPVEQETEYCFDCAKRIKVGSFSNFEQGKALFLYQGEIKQTMYRFKYSNRREYADFFVEEVCRRYGDWIRNSGIEAVVPVPMYRSKEKRRGYNQAKLLAKGIAREMGLVYAPDIIERVRDTRPQKELNDEERKNNLKSAFQTRKDVVQYSYILLVDDIYTTGYTAEAVAEELRRAGAAKVFFLAVCTGKGY